MKEIEKNLERKEREDRRKNVLINWDGGKEREKKRGDGRNLGEDRGKVNVGEVYKVGGKGGEEGEKVVVRSG